MLLIVPPSEGKNAPADGAPVDLARLSFPELTRPRKRMISGLRKLSRGPQAEALKQLKLGPKSRDELGWNRALTTAPAASAATVYTGVLFERLDLDGLSAAARQRAAAQLLIASALWGVLRPDDRIPAYRHAAAARLPGLPTTATHWQSALAAALPSDELLVDFRSGPYRGMWRGPADAPTLTVNVFRDGPRGRTVVSHFAKATRGDVARTLLEDADAWAGGATPESVAARVADAGWAVELGAPDPSGTVELAVIERD
ncbi:MAG: peroxide stress protein YaaA [Patulibacter sp.]|nr:peroxide stress protein YaaA [Patulibacter sp.]